MRSRLTRKALIIGAVLLFVGVALAFAHDGGWGRGYGHMGGDGHMMAYGPGSGMGPGMMYGYGHRGARHGANLTAEQQKNLDDTREKFFNETRKLRDSIQDQRYTLNQELSKENPDAAKVGKIQKELSNLESEFDQKAVQHQLEVRKILPDDYRRAGFGPGYGYCGR